MFLFIMISYTLFFRSVFTDDFYPFLDGAGKFQVTNQKCPKSACVRGRDVPDTTSLDTGFNRIVIYWIPDSSKFKRKS